MYSPFSYQEGALIKLASCACDILNQPEMVRDVNVESDVVEDISINISRITTAYCKMLNKMIPNFFNRSGDLPQYIGSSVDTETNYGEILSMVKKRCFFDRTQDLPAHV